MSSTTKAQTRATEHDDEDGQDEDESEEQESYDDGDGEDAGRLIQLRLQAEALLGVTDKEDDAARHRRFRKEGETAI